LRDEALQETFPARDPVAMPADLAYNIKRVIAIIGAGPADGGDQNLIASRKPRVPIYQPAPRPSSPGNTSAPPTSYRAFLHGLGGKRSIGSCKWATSLRLEQPLRQQNLKRDSRA
jgi:hypothetical protein